jgi:hypothetical protein
LGILLAFTAISGLRAQEGAGAPAGPCENAEINLAFQSSPSDGPQHQSHQRYDRAVEELAIEVSEGETGRRVLHAAIVSRLPGERGVQGWAVQTRASGGILIVDATTAGTAAAVSPDGLVSGGFSQTRVPSLRGESGFYSAAVLSFSDPSTLLPVGTSTVISFTVEAKTAQGEDPIEGVIEWVDGCVGCSVPFVMSAMVNGATRHFCSRPVLEVAFVDDSPAAPFLRCDPSGNGKLEVVDAIFIANHLFLNRPASSCLDSEDCNGDFAVNLTDVIFAISFLFDGGPAPPAPFPACAEPALTIGLDSCLAGGGACR